MFESQKKSPISTAPVFFNSTKNNNVFNKTKTGFSFIQPKLIIGATDEVYEKQAEAMADKVMESATRVLFMTNNISDVQRKCSHCEEEEKLQRKENNSDSTSLAQTIVHDVLNSGGRSLDADTRSYMEPRFNYDFSNVKIHDNDIAAKSADSINALAYTSGNDIVFNSGQYNPDSDSGKRLLAHELTHVVQQKNNFSIQRFDSPEHVQLGDSVQPTIGNYILLSSHSRDLPQRESNVSQWPDYWQNLFNMGNNIQKRFLRQGLSYGEMLALSGDFYETFDDLNNAPLREIYDLLPLIRGHASTTQLESATGGRYLDLAKRNDSHFSIVASGRENNMATWRRIHTACEKTNPYNYHKPMLKIKIKTIKQG